MAKLITLLADKTYATHANAVKAVEKRIPEHILPNQRYIIVQNLEDGRFFPVFIGMDALQHGIHFHFNVLA